MGSLPELRHLDSPQHAPRRSFGASAGLQVRPSKGSGGKPTSTTQPIKIDRGGVHTLTPALLEIHGGVGRRRESCASSVGAASVRRLVRGGGGGGGGGPPAPRQRCPVQAAWARRATAACAARFFAAAPLLVLQALQGSFGAWGSGAILLAILHWSGAVVALCGPALVSVARPHRLLTVAYLLFALFFFLHIYPKTYIMIPAYIAAGACWTLLALAHETILGELACESCPSASHGVTLQSHSGTSGNNNAGGGGSSPPERRTLLRRLTRASRFARDCGLLMAALLLPFLPSSFESTRSHLASFNKTNCAYSQCGSDNRFNNTLRVETALVWEDQNNATDISRVVVQSEEDIEDWKEEACGSRGCPGTPVPAGMEEDERYRGGVSVEFLPYVMGAWCLMAALCSLWCWDGVPRKESGGSGPVPWRSALVAFKDIKMRLAGPLALFIGLEQGFLYAHFLQWYVVCVSGRGAVWRALGGAALLRALVAATLSMLLAHGRRRLVAGVGLVWHACLLLALGAWRAVEADQQLPPGMAAAWAGCGAVWDLLLPTLVNEPVPGGRASLAISLRALGLALAITARFLLCTRWALRALFLALPAAALPLLFAPD